MFIKSKGMLFSFKARTTFWVQVETPIPYSLKTIFFFLKIEDREEIVVISTVSHIFIYKYHEFLTLNKKERDLDRSSWPVRELTSHLQLLLPRKVLATVAADCRTQA